MLCYEKGIAGIVNLSYIFSNFNQFQIRRDSNHVTFKCSCAIQLTNEMMPVRFRPGKQNPNLVSKTKQKNFLLTFELGIFFFNKIRNQQEISIAFS